MRALILKWGRVVGIDHAIGNVVAARFWSLISGPTTIYLIAQRLSPEQQGFYYTFGNVLSAQIILELGLSSVIMQFASHEMAGLQWEGNRLAGDPLNRARLNDLLRKSIRWYGGVALLLLLVFLPLGMLFLASHGGTADSAVNWKGPWISLVVTNAISTVLAPMVAIIQGCGRVAEVTRVRMFEGMATGIGLWIGLLSGAQLYSPPLAGFAAILVTCSWLFATKLETFRDLLAEKAVSTLSWQQEILPMQWRTGVSWVGWYVSTQLFTPAVFAALGAAIAGRLGMTLNLINVVGATSIAWMDTKAAPLGQMAAQRDWDKLDRTYRKALRQSMGVLALGCLALLVFIQILRWFGHPIGQRVLDLPTTLVFMAAAGTTHIVACRGIYQRAHKAELLYGWQVASGCIVAGILFLTSRLGLFYLSVAYLLCTCIPLLLISRLIFTNFRTKMHV